MPLNALERLRMRLLDLTARNRLIHFRHTKRGSLRIIDELPNQLVEKLLSETEMRFRPIPEPTREELIESGYIETDEITRQDRRLREKPTVEEWAERLGFRTSYEAPVPGAETTDERHTDNAIQTLLYPFALESRLKSLRQASESAIQEMGANILYLAFGFLEWSENINGDLRIAPLFMLPVRLQKGRLNPNTKIYQYTISYSGEDIIPNLSLKEKLRNDFGMALLDLDENTDPEVYFGEVQELIQENQPNWRLRRYITLTLLNFSKLLMYLDLDPSRWPEDDNIIDHRVVGKFLSCYNTDHGQEEDDNVDLGFGEEYSIDETDNIHKKYPLIDDADSSQHSALIDAVDGKNLVIEGPPGTGKSQTITNLIAAAMAQGKKVLFVSEKLAALEVVRHRLDIAGLGEFCLELHSHKSQKRKVLDEIKSRLDKRNHYRMPSEIERDITRYEELKTKLKDYAERINQPWKNTDKTLHQIFMGAVRYREAIGINPNTLNFEGYGGDNLDTNTQRRMEDQVEIFGNIYQAVADQLGGDSELQQHPWYGARNTDLQIFDLDDVRSVLKNWQCSLRNLNEERTELALGLECEQGEIADSLNGVSLLLKDLERLPALEGDELLCQLPVLKGADLGKAEEYLYLFEDIQSRYANLAQMIGPDVLEDLSVVPDLFAGSQQITRLVQPMIQLGRLMDVIDKLTVVQDQLAELDNPLQQIRAIVGEEAASHLSSTKRGFTEFRCFVDLVASLDFRHWTLRDERFDNEELDDLLPNLRNDLERLYTLRDELQCVFCLDPLPSQSDLKLIRETLDSGGVFRWFKGSWRAARKQILGLAMDNQVRFSKLYSLLKKLEEFSRRRQQLDENNYYEEGLGGHLEGLETKLPALESLRDWYKTVRQQYGVGFGPRVALGNAIVALPVNIVRVVHSLSDQGVQEQLVNLLADLAQSEEIFTPASASKLTDDRSLLAGEGNVISNLLVSLNSALSSCQPLVDNATSVEELAVHAGLLDLLKTAVDEWESDDYDNVPFQERLGLGLGVHVDNTTPLSTFRHTLAIASCVDRQLTNDNVRQKIYAKPESSTFNALNELSTQLRTLVEKQETQYEAFAHLVGLERDDWMQLSGDQLDKLIARNNRAMNNPETLHKWLSYVRTRNRIENMGLVGLAIAVEQGDLDIQQVDDACKAKIFDVLAREILREQPELENFSGQSQKAIQKQFRRYDNSLKKLQCEKISWEIDQTSVPAGNRHGRVSTFSELGLLWHVCSLQRPRISIRQLLHRAGGALVALKPCFMMGPMSVAQYLKPGQIKFDLVVMDEASQIKPQDALGAIARGSQLVVVGDPKQLPPTSFFDRVLDDDDGDQDDTDGDQNDTAIEQSESILDATLPMFPAKRLRWHYRSQHESLIAFSNHSFYDGNLVLFPSPHNHKRNKGYGIKYERVEHGCFTNKQNMEEARRISDAVRDHARNWSEETLGVVAMSAKQRLHIEDAIETLAKEDDVFQEWLENDSHRDEPLFIKNLENVQGDERDVIFISMTYGPNEPHGRVHQRFGPINLEKGWRRLNVLFSRSKKRMHIFSSMKSDDIIIGAATNRGVKSLRDFLKFCETESLPELEGETGKPPDSDFEIAVMTALRDEGFTCKPQFGVAGYFIDVVVVDPGNRGRYLMGIECDGATYHSAKSTRDRDRLRQEILERRGWKIRRIWSTDWFRDYRSELNPIIRELNSIKTERVIDPLQELEEGEI